MNDTGRAGPRRRRPWHLAPLAALTLVAAQASVALTPGPASAATIEAGAWYTLVNRTSGKAIDVANCDTADGAVVRQWSRTGATCQQFRFESAASGWWRIVARHSGKALDLWEWNTADGAEFRQWPITAGENQQFKAVVQSDGYVRFVNRHSNKALEVWDGSTADGGRISQRTDSSGTNQQWQLVRADGATTSGNTGSTTGNTGTASSGTTKPSTGSTSSGSTGAWPSAAGSQVLAQSLQVTGVYDGALKRYTAGGAMGDGGQDESQDPLFVLSNGSTLQNVIIGSPAGDGVHCTGTCTLKNVWWEDVGEDAATLKGSNTSQVMTIDGGGARKASDKVFQHNGPGTMVIRNFQVSDFGKLYRSCGNCKTQFKRTVQISDVTVTAPGKTLVGINTNYGDTATLSRITIVGDSSKKISICDRFTGNSTGAEPSKTGSGPGSGCSYSASDITYR